MAPATNGAPVPAHKHLWIVTGPAGCGKTTTAEYLAKQLSLSYLEGDRFHPQANIDKMANNIPLTDADRWDWLIALREHSVAALQAGAAGVVLTCSCLKKKYRDVLRIAAYHDPTIMVYFVYLHATQEALLKRVHARVGHYMKDSMVTSQFVTLEAPSTDEKDVLTVDAMGDLDSVQKLTLEVMDAAMAKEASRAA